MDLLTTLRVLNTILAIISITPSIYLLESLRTERKVIKTESKMVNTILTVIAACVGVAGIINSAASVGVLLIDNSFIRSYEGNVILSIRLTALSIIIIVIGMALSYLIHYYKNKDSR